MSEEITDGESKLPRPLDADSISNESGKHQSKKLKTGPLTSELKLKKEQVTKELDELKSKLKKKPVEENQGEDENFLEIIDTAFETSMTENLDSNLSDVDRFLEEHKKIDERLVSTKKSKIFALKSKTKKVKKSASMLSVTQQRTAGGSIYEHENSSKSTLSSKLKRRISVRKSGSHTLRSSISQNTQPPTVVEGSETEGEDKEVITYKKVFKDNKELSSEEVAKLKESLKTKQTAALKEQGNDTILDDSEENIETFQFQFEFSKIKLNEEKLRFSESITNAVDAHTAEENKTTTLISNSHNGKVTTTTIRPKQTLGSKGLFSGLGISSGIASIYSSIFSWGKRS